MRLFLTQHTGQMYHPGRPENAFPPGIVRQRLSPARSVAVNLPVVNMLHQPWHWLADGRKDPG
ncbi:hypothetical protein NLO62_22920 [Escherichia coli]|nr:hypothetical protein [Escherichia coli]MDF6391345.1 hypothetical protein [Escherichia coli]WMO42908.1 hypothetical protein PCS97_04525 [Escherichia coli]